MRSSIMIAVSTLKPVHTSRKTEREFQLSRISGYGLYTLHGTGTGTGTGMGTIENNGNLSLPRSLCSMYST